MENPDPQDRDLDDPQINALTTPDLDGDDIQEVDEDTEDSRTDRDPAEGGDDIPEARPA